MVVGDPVLDVYLNGFSDRVSREAPVLIVREESRDHRLGGAANTAANLAALGARVTLAGFVGADPEAETLRSLLPGAAVDGALVPRVGGPTITKTRVMAGGLHIRKQQMLRIDREHRSPADDAQLAALREVAERALADAAALVVSDYGDPSMTHLYVDLAQQARKTGRTVVVDSRHRLLRFTGVTAVTPNEPEVEAIFGRRLEGPEDALRAAGVLRHRLDVDAALLTRGREGMAIAGRDGAEHLIGAVGGDAVDVTGAGDTVAAAFTLGLVAGAPVLDAAKLANHAASITVQRVGTAVCTRAELEASLRSA